MYAYIYLYILHPEFWDDTTVKGDFSLTCKDGLFACSNMRKPQFECTLALPQRAIARNSQYLENCLWLGFCFCRPVPGAVAVMVRCIVSSLHVTIVHAPKPPAPIELKNFAVWQKKAHS